MGPQQEVPVGRVSRPRGVAGEVQVEVMSDFPGRFASGEVIFVAGVARRIQRSYRPKPHLVVLKLEGIDSIDAAALLRGTTLTVPLEAVPPLPEGRYYHFQLMGMEVYTSQGELLGCITDIFPTGSNDVYAVTLDGRQVLIPAIDDVVQEVDVEASRMTVDLPEGLR